jgi:hypothetical protein
MDPITALALAQTGYQAYQGYQQNKQAKELAKGGPADIVPLAYKQMLANQQNQANNAQVAGYGQAIDEINQDAATTLGEAKRAGVSPSNLYNILSRLNQQKGAQKRRLYAAGQEAQERRLGTYNTGLMGKARMDEQARQEQEEAIGALRGAGMQNYYNAFTTGIGALGYGRGMGGGRLAEKQNLLESEGYSPLDMENTDYRQMGMREIARKLQNSRTPSGYMAPDAYQSSLLNFQ